MYRIKKISAVLLILSCSLANCNGAFGQRIYQLVNYPQFQDGGTLTGFISVRDSYFETGRPNDAGAFRDFDWSATSSNGSISADSNSGITATATTPNSITITENAIFLTPNPQFSLVHLVLGEQFGSDFDGTFVSRKLEYQLSSTPGETVYRVIEWAGDTRTAIWESFPPSDGLGGTSWVIAVRVVPEPASAMLLIVGGVWLLIRRRRS